MLHPQFTSFPRRRSVCEGRGSGVSTGAGSHMKGFLLDNAPESRGVARQQIVPVCVSVCVWMGGWGGGLDPSHVDAP